MVVNLDLSPPHAAHTHSHTPSHIHLGHLNRCDSTVQAPEGGLSWNS